MNVFTRVLKYYDTSLCAQKNRGALRTLSFFLCAGLFLVSTVSVAMFSGFPNAGAAAGPANAQAVHQAIPVIPSLTEWIAQMEKLSGSTSFVAKEVFVQACQAARSIYLQELVAGGWYAGKSMLVKGVEEGKTFYQAMPECYVQKISIQQDDTVFFFGDIHGDARALLRALQKLMADGYLAENFRLKAHTRLVFLGDYGDRGPCSAEVLLLALALKIHNPEQVFLLRGNHETTGASEDYGDFTQELERKYGLDQPARSLLVHSLFEMLPVALYVGFESGVAHEKAWALCCHAGPEIGVAVRDFLGSPDAAQYLWIDKISRAECVQQLPEDIKQTVNRCWEMVAHSEIAKCAREAAEEWAAINSLASLKRKREGSQAGVEEGSAAQTSVEAYLPNFDQKNVDACVVQLGQGDIDDIGYLWSDFIVAGQDAYAYVPLRGFALGEALARALAQRDGVAMIVRGHQHSAALYELLYRNGCISLFNGLVQTLISGNVAPQRQDIEYSFAHFSYSAQERTWLFVPQARIHTAMDVQQGVACQARPEKAKSPEEGLLCDEKLEEEY